LKTLMPKERPMSKITKFTITTVLTAFVAALVVFISYPAPAQAPSSVTVVNGPGNPVPTSAVGTTTVSGSVTAVQRGSWLVRAVQASPWRISNVLNSSNAPVPLVIVNADDPGRIPYQSSANLNSCLAAFCSFVFNNPSPDHRLVVQHIVGSWTNTVMGATLIVIAQDRNGAPRSQSEQSGAWTGDVEEFFFDQPVQVYVDPGSFFTVFMSVTAGNSLGGSVGVSGYLLDCVASPCAPIAQSPGTG
jgi:hypothetical protein